MNNGMIWCIVAGVIGMTLLVLSGSHPFDVDAVVLFVALPVGVVYALFNVEQIQEQLQGKAQDDEEE